MNIKEKKIKLRELRENDMELLNSLMNDEEVEHNVIGWSKPVTMSEQMQWYRNISNDQNIRYAIVDINDTEIYGTGIISRIDWKNGNCSIDIKLDKRCQNHGYGSEAISLLLKHAFDELNMNSVNVKIISYNIASQKAFEKNGFKKTGVLRSNIYKNGKYNDVYIYDLLKEEYINEGNR